MSKDNAYNFLTSNWTDEEAKRQLTSLTTVEETIALAASQGHEFSETDYYEAFSDFVDAQDIELSGAQLDMVSGGTSVGDESLASACCCCCCYFCCCCDGGEQIA